MKIGHCISDTCQSTSKCEVYVRTTGNPWMCCCGCDIKEHAVKGKIYYIID